MLKRLWQYKPFRVFIWNVFNGAITLVTTRYVAQTNPNLVAIAPLVMASLTLITKWINNRFFNDLWVTKVS